MRAGQVLEFLNPSFADLTTLRLGGNALALLRPQTINDLPLLAERARSLGGSLFPLGRGSNILAHDGDLPLALVSMSAFSDIAIKGQDEDFIYVRAGAGVPLKRLLRFCLENGLGGLEGLTGIPGQVGGSLAMNAGSFGVELGARLRGICAWQDEKLFTVPASGLERGYRKLTMRNNRTFPLVVTATFALTRRLKKDIFRRMNLNYMEKKFRQPLGAWSGGCAFKNPAEGLSAGRLLDECGLRGFRLGGMCFSEKHANFLVNGGCGTAAEAFEILDLARRRVLEKRGINLELELRTAP